MTAAILKNVGLSVEHIFGGTVAKPKNSTTHKGLILNAIESVPRHGSSLSSPSLMSYVTQGASFPFARHRLINVRQFFLEAGARESA